MQAGELDRQFAYLASVTEPPQLLSLSIFAARLCTGGPSFNICSTSFNICHFCLLLVWTFLILWSVFGPRGFAFGATSIRPH